jgi:hypothetical protein
MRLIYLIKNNAQVRVSLRDGIIIALFSFQLQLDSASKFGNTLKGSMGEKIDMTASGPRLSTDEPMRNSAEAYLKGSMEVSYIYCYFFFSLRFNPP